MLKQQIAANLETTFGQFGFAESSVAQLQKASGVSLRTLYKYYPSKEDMIVAALESRHQRYLKLLEADISELGFPAIEHIFSRLKHWMQHSAPKGCMSMQALAAFPDNQQIADVVNQHKHELKLFLGQQSQRQDLATALFILHEGVSSSWPVLGDAAVKEAIEISHSLLK